MRKAIFCAILLFALTSLVKAGDSTRIHLVPQPVSVRERPGEFLLDHTGGLVGSGKDTGLESTTQWFSGKVADMTGVGLASGRSGKKSIRVELNSVSDENIGKEGYILSITPTAVIVHANTSAGIFYGLQTFLQLVPSTGVRAVPCAVITDYPRFG